MTTTEFLFSNPFRPLSCWWGSVCLPLACVKAFQTRWPARRVKLLSSLKGVGKKITEVQKMGGVGCLDCLFGGGRGWWNLWICWKGLYVAPIWICDITEILSIFLAKEGLFIVETLCWIGGCFSYVEEMVWIRQGHVFSASAHREYFRGEIKFLEPQIYGIIWPNSMLMFRNVP